MNPKESLLEQLRIDRSTDEEAPPVSARLWQILAAGAVVLAAAGAGVWFGRVRDEPRAAVQSLAAQSAAARAPSAADHQAKGAVQAAGVGAAAEGSMLDASGYIVAQRQATVSAKSAFKVRELLFQEGQSVKAGDILARMDDSNTLAALEAAHANLSQAQGNLEAARIALADSVPIFERSERQLKEHVMSAQDFDNAKITYDTAQATYLARQEAVAVARANLIVAQRAEDDTIVRAPFSGVVTAKNAQPGEMISPMATSGFTRTGICTIVDMGSLEAEVDVSESFINRVHPGQPAEVRLNAYADWAIPGRVLAVIPTADRSKATVKVRVGLEVQDARILPEMGTRVAFLAGKGQAEQPGQR